MAEVSRHSETTDGVKSKVALILQGESDDGTSCDERYSGDFAMVMVLDEEKAELKAFGSMTEPMAFHAMKVLHAELDDINKAYPRAAFLFKLHESIGPDIEELMNSITGGEEENDDE